MRSTTWKWSRTRTQNHAGDPISLSLASYAINSEKYFFCTSPNLNHGVTGFNYGISIAVVNYH